jgi:drug/metabolite transporter (DMT)-like permease
LIIGCCLAFVRNAALGFGYAVYGVLTDYPLFTGQALRFAIAAGALFVVAKLRLGRLPHPSGADMRRIVVLAGTGLAGFSILLLLASRYADPATIGTVIGCAPLVFALAGPLIDRRTPAARVLVAALLAALGAVVVEGGTHTAALGIVFACGALVSMTIVGLLGASMLPRIPPSALALYIAVATAALFTAFAPLVDGRAFLRAPKLHELEAICYLGLVQSAAGLLAWYAAINRIRVERAGLFLAIVPIMALLGGPVLGTGTVTLPQIGGTTLVTGALLIELAPAAFAMSSRALRLAPAPAAAAGAGELLLAEAPVIVVNGAVSMRLADARARDRQFAPG